MDGRTEEKVTQRDGVRGEETDGQDMLSSRTQTG